MKCKPSYRLILSSKHLVPILVIIITISLSSLTANAKQEKELERKKRLNFELNIKENCNVINFPNATLNECGYCVGGGTGLSADYGKDCAGICFGSNTFDCNGICGGNAYIDECTGRCIGLDELTTAVENATTNRDCRGLCIQPLGDLGNAVPVPVQTYKADQCGVCRLSAANVADPTSSGGSFFTSSLNCNNNCQLPGLIKSNIVCGQCVRNHELFHVIDDCGNCLAEGHFCSCDRDPTKCGCIDSNNCYIIKQLSPAAIPKGVHVNISVVGYFYPIVKQLYCVVQRQGFELIESFPVQFLHKNKTFVECDIQLEQEGEHVLGLGFRPNVFITPPKDLLQIYVFDPSAVNISLVGPIESYTNDSETNLSIMFREENNRLPLIPIKCRIVYEYGAEEISDFGTKPNTCLLRKSKLRGKSQKLKLYPTYDDKNWLPVYVEHVIKAQAPKMSFLSSFISEDSLAIIVNFDQPINLEYIERHIRGDDDGENDADEVLMMCNYLLGESTLEHLAMYGLYSCRWATRVQLIISILRPLASDSIEIKIKSQVLIEYDQKYAQYNKEMLANVSKLSTTINWWSYEPKVAIVGPSEIPECGDFALIGQFSSPRGSTEVEFQWLVGGDASKELQQYVTRNGKSTNLLFNVDMFEVGHQYTFIFRAYIQTRRQQLETSHTLIKHDYECPFVSIYSTQLLATSPLLTERDSTTLFADIKFPDCIYPPQRIIAEWFVNDPKFRFPVTSLSKRFAAQFTIESYTIPVNHSTSIYLNAFIGLYQNQTTHASYHLETGQTPLKANLADGINKITIGSNSGILRLSSKNDNRKRVVYQWSCHETKSGNPCYFNFGSVPVGFHRSPVLITRDLQTLSELRINSSWFLPNNQYLIGLQVFDANNSKIASETEYTLMNVVHGVKPQVFVGPAYIKNKYVVPYNSQFSTFLIPSGSPIHIKGKAYLDAGLKSIRWESKSFRYPLHWTTKRISTMEIVTELIIHSDNLMAYGVYHFELFACSFQNECSSSEISLMATQSTVTCNLVVDSYVELEFTLANIEKCSIPPAVSPITYQLFLEDENYQTLLPLSLPQLSPVILFAGSPAFSRNHLTRLAAKVCDRYDTCNVFYSQPISVEASHDLSGSIKMLVERARRFYRFGDFLTGLNYLNSVFIKPISNNDGSNNLTLYKRGINLTIDICSDILQSPSVIMGNGHYEVATNTLSFALLKTENFGLRQKLLDLIVKFYEKAEAFKNVPSMNSIRTTYSNIMNSFILSDSQKLKNVTNEVNYLRSLRRTFRQIKKVTTANMPLGTRIVLVAERPTNVDAPPIDNGDENGVRIQTAITEFVHFKTPFDLTLQARSSANQTVMTKVQFGEEIKQNFNSNWNCSQTMPCSSLIYTVTIFPEQNPYPMNVQSHKLSPVVDISIHAPSTGEEQAVRGLFKAAVFDITVTGNISYGGNDYVIKCHYYDEDKQEWRIDDVHPMGIAYNQAGCWSGHLSSFVVLRTVLGINTDYIIGVLVACLMGVFVFGIMLVFYMQRQKEDVSVAPQEVVTPSNISADSSPMSAHYNPKDRKGTNGKPKILRSMRDSTEIQSKTILITD